MDTRANRILATLAAVLFTVALARAVYAQQDPPANIACSEQHNEAKLQAWHDYDECKASYWRYLDWWTGGNTCMTDRDNALRQAQEDYASCMASVR